MANLFFNFLRRKGVRPGRIEERISSWNDLQLRSFTAEAADHLQVTKESPTSRFAFVANSQLSGGPVPCMGTSCRLEHVDQLARFAALYADKVLVHNPFERYHSESPRELDRKVLADDIRVLYYLKPLVEAGLVDFSSGAFHYCEPCYRELVEEPRLLMRLEEGRMALLDRYEADTTVYLSALRPEGPFYVEVEGSQNLIEHGHAVILLRSELSQAMKKSVKIGKRRALTLKEVRTNHLLDSFAGEVTHDVFRQNLYAANGYSYLTDREIDFELISALNPQNVNALTDAILKGLAHVVPLVPMVKIDRLIALRKAEGEAFQVYRDSLKRLLTDVMESRQTNSDVIRDAFADLVRPEINKIEAQISRSRRLLFSSLREDVIFATGFVSIGLFGGILPPDLANIVAGLGGFKFISNVLATANKLMKEPDAIRESSWYFLWRVGKMNPQRRTS